jgi:hypothetical protein
MLLICYPLKPEFIKETGVFINQNKLDRVEMEKTYRKRW